MHISDSRNSYQSILSRYVIPGILILCFFIGLFPFLHSTGFHDDKAYVPAITYGDEWTHFKLGHWGDLISGHPPFRYALDFILARIAPHHEMFIIRLEGLLFSCLILWVVFLWASDLTGSYYVAAVVMLCIMIQPIYLAQSVLITLEPPIVLSVILTLFFYGRGKLAWAACWAVLSVYAKESGIFIGFGFFLTSLYFYFTDGDKVREKRELLYFSAPFIWYLCWISFSKIFFGRFFYLPHIQTISFSPSWLISNLITILSIIFIEQGRLVVTLTLLLILLFGRDSRKAWMFDLRLTMVLALLFLSMIGFSAINRVNDRYMLYPIVVYLIIALCFIFNYFKHKWYILATTVVVFVFCSIIFIESGHQNVDVDFTFLHVIRNYSKAVSMIQKRGIADRKFMVTAPFTNFLEDPHFGYVDSPMHIVENNQVNLDSAEYFIYDPAGFGQVSINEIDQHFDLLDSVQDHPAKIYLYKHR